MGLGEGEEEDDEDYFVFSYRAVSSYLKIPGKEERGERGNSFLEQ